MTTKQGLKFTKQGFLNCLANPFYIGKIHIPAWEDEPAQTIDGLQAPIISEETFYEVRHILSGKKNSYKGITRKDELVLASYLVCPIFGRPITGSASKGYGGYYHYYSCLAKYGCKSRISTLEANQGFVNYLRNFEPSKAVQVLYHRILEDVFNRSEVEKEAERSKLEQEIKGVQIRINFLEMKMIDDVIDGETYKNLKKNLTEQKNTLIMKHASINKVSREFRKYLSYGFNLCGQRKWILSKCYSIR